MNHITVILSLFSSLAHAEASPTQYLIETKVYEGSKLVSHPRVVVIEGQEAEAKDANGADSDYRRLKLKPRKIDGKLELEVGFSSRGGVSPRDSFVRIRPTLGALTKVDLGKAAGQPAHLEITVSEAKPTP